MAKEHRRKLPSPSLAADFRQALDAHQRGEGLRAEVLCQSILAAEPKHFDAMHLLGLIHAGRGDTPAAADWVRRAIELQPDNVDLRATQARLLALLGRFPEAIAAVERAMALRRRDADLMKLHGALLMDCGRPLEALASFEAALEQRPADAEAHRHRGAALFNAGRREAALASFDRAVALAPKDAEAWLSRATALKHLEKLDEAIDSYGRAIAVRPGFARAYKNRAYCRLLAGAFEAGWADYEHRWQSEDFPTKRPALDLPHWSGEPLAGRSILVYFEQGFGDTIQFSRYLPLLAESGANVCFLAPARMLRLLETLPAPIRLIDRIDKTAKFDFQCALMSLPLRFATSSENIPSQVPYLRADAERVAVWRERIGAQGFKIGLAWQGNPATGLDLGRSMALRAFHPLAQIRGVRLISLQKGAGAEQASLLPPGMRLETLGADFDAGPDAFVDTAAVMQHLDLVISVDTAVAHLAGALARPAWVALKRVPDWRWMMQGSHSPWYPTLRLFRQKTADDWRSVIEDMAGELRHRLAGEFGEGPEPAAAAGEAFSGTPVRRNDLCPCGSGKRFKHCHGALPV